jgi:hypothetical protein
MKSEVRRTTGIRPKKRKPTIPKFISRIKRTAFFIISWIILRDLSTIQFRLAFKDKGHNFHKSLEYCCLVIHLTSVSKYFLRWIEGWYFYPYCAITHSALQIQGQTIDILYTQTYCEWFVCLSANIRTARDLSTIQFRLIFKGHKSQEYCCLVIHLTSVNTISCAESNDCIFILIAGIRHYNIIFHTTDYSFHVPQLTIRDCCCINFILIWHQYASHKVVIY